MNPSRIEHQNLYLAEKNSQLIITNGSYLLRLIILNHPIIEGKVSIDMGVLSKKNTINTNCFYNTEETWQVQIQLIPLEGSSEHEFIRSDDLPIDMSISFLLNVFEKDEVSLLHRKQSTHPIPNSIIFENSKSLPSCHHFSTTSNCISRFLSENMKQSDIPSLFIDNFNVKPYLLETPIVIIPAHVTYISGNKELAIDQDWKTTVNANLSVDEISKAWFNFITSIYLFARIDNYDKQLTSKSLRKRSNELSNIILSDYSGKEDISLVSNALASLPNIVVDQLREYLGTIGLKLDDLCLPSQFSSENLAKKITQVLDISYIPYRKFNTNKIHDCKKIGSYMLFQDDKTQLHLQSNFRRVILPKDASIAEDRSITCIQIFERLPEKVRWWTLLAFMLRGTYIELIVVITIALVLALITLLPPLVITYALSSLLPYSSVIPFIQIIGLLFVIGSAAFLLKLIQARYAVRLETKADINIQSFSTSRLLQLPAEAILNENSGDLESRVSYLSQLRSIFTTTLSPFLTLSLTILFNLGLLAYYSWTSAIFSLLPLSILVCSSLYVGYAKSNLLKTVLKNDGKIFAGLFTFMKGTLPIRSNLCTDYVRLNYLESARPLFVSLFKATRLGNRLDTIDSIIRPLTYVFIFAIISFMMSNGWETGITIAVFAGFSAALTTVFTSTRTLVDSIFGKIIQGVAIWQRSLEFLEIKPENPYSTISRLNPTGKVTFKNVYFRYPKSPEDTIKNISFDVASGEFIGITGESGCGKSTLMRMAYAVLEPSKGTVYYDRVSQTQANKRSLRQNFGVITQDVKLMNGSLRDNLLAGMYFEDSKIFQILEVSCLRNFVDSLPMGLETMMSETSTSFSMGQRQLIIIARALLRRPRILFMDEATSYLDRKTESLITKNIKALGITRFAVAHRLSSIEEANRILMLGEGEILGFDSHSNLLQNCPEYKQLHSISTS